MQVGIVTAPGKLPIALSTALRHIRALEDDADLVELYCRAAVQAVEDYTGRAMATTVYCAQLDSWPQFDGDSSFGKVALLRSPASRNRVVDAIELPRSPLVAIDWVKYYPLAGGAQVAFDATNYRLDTKSLPGRLVLVDGYTFPDVAIRHDAVEIQFQAGSGTKESGMNPLLVTAVLQLARHFFDNPSCVDADGKVREMPYSYRMMLRSQRI